MEDDQTEDGLFVNEIVDTSQQPLSPIVEMDESNERSLSEEKGEDVVDGLEDVNKNRMANLTLETFMENIEERSQPVTPPEVLRQRLNFLLSDYEELKEFTDLEKQIYHSECIPKEKVKSFEEQFACLNEKIEHLMQENLIYEKKLELKEKQTAELETKLAKAENLQIETQKIVAQIRDELRENIKNVAVVGEDNQSLPLPTLASCRESSQAISPVLQSTGPILSSLKDLHDLMEAFIFDKHKIQEKAHNLQLTNVALNGTVEELNDRIVVYQQNLTSAKSGIVYLQEKFAGIEIELSEISKTLVQSENKRLEAEHLKAVVSQENCKLQDQMDNFRSSLLEDMQEKINLFLSKLEENFIDLLDSTVTKDTLIENIKDIPSHLDLFLNSNTQSCLLQVLHKLMNKFTTKNDECNHLHSTIEHLNNHIEKLENEILEYKREVEMLHNQVVNELETRVVKLETCFVNTENENIQLKNELDGANKKIVELSNDLTDSKTKLQQLQHSLNENMLEKSDLENEILKLQECLAVDENENMQLKNKLNLENKEMEQLLNDLTESKTKLHQLQESLDNIMLEKSVLENEMLKDQLNLCNLRDLFIVILKELELFVVEWDTDTQFIDVFTVLEGNERILCFISLLMDIQTQTTFCEVVSKLKMKLLLYYEEKNNLRGTVQNLKGVLDRVENENKTLRLEVKTLDHHIREEINNRISELEKIFNLAVDEKEHQKCKIDLVDEETVSLYSTEIKPEEYIEDAYGKNLLQNVNNECDKLQKEINNLNKAAKADDALEKCTHVLNKIESFIDSWDCSKEIKGNMLSFQLDEKLLNTSKHLCSKLQVDLNRIVEKLKAKLIEFVEKTGQLQETKMLNGSSSGNKYASNSSEEITNIKKLMILEITSLDSEEDKEYLMHELLEDIFSKLMEIIMRKEQEMSCTIQKQFKAELVAFEQTVEKLNNKLKSQESWINSLETDNEKMSSELCSLKTLNHSFSCKLNELSNNVKSKTLEVSTLKSNIVELTTENDTLVADLNMTKLLVQSSNDSVKALQNDVQNLSEELLTKTGTIRDLKSKLSSAAFDKQKPMANEVSLSYLCKFPENGKGDSLALGENESLYYQSSNMYFKGSNDTLRNQNGPNNEPELYLSEELTKETALIKEMLSSNVSYVVLSELILKCSEKLEILKDIVQIIASKIMDFEMSKANALQSMETIVECKTKELQDLKLSISELYEDFAPNTKVQLAKFRSNDESFNRYSNVISLKNELELMKEECLDFHSRSEELEESAKMGKNILQNIRVVFEIIKDENHYMTKLIDDLRRSVVCEQEKNIEQKTKCDVMEREINNLMVKNSILENQITSMQSEMSKLKREMFSELDIDFPGKMQSHEKVVYINNMLKQFADDKKTYEIVTEDLRFFVSQFKLVVSYVETIQNKLYFAVQQKEQLENEINVLKVQFSALNSQNAEMNKFMNQLISKSPFTISTLNQAVEVMSCVFSEYKFLKENQVKFVHENKTKQDKILQQQQELNSLAKDNCSLKFELSKCEEWIRNLRSELRTIRLQSQRRDSSCGFSEAKPEKTEIGIQTEYSCCKKLQKKVTEQKEKIDMLSATLTKNELQAHVSPGTTNPYNKQVSYLEEALNRAKERIRRLKFELTHQESYNQELLKSLKVHGSCQDNREQAL